MAFYHRKLGWTPTQYPTFYYAIQIGYPHAIPTLLQFGANIGVAKSGSEHHRRSSLHLAALRKYNKSFVTEILLNHGADVNATENRGRTVLRICTVLVEKGGGWLGVSIAMIISARAEVDKEDGDGVTPFAMAVILQNHRMAKLLVRPGSRNPFEGKSWERSQNFMGWERPCWMEREDRRMKRLEGVMERLKEEMERLKMEKIKLEGKVGIVVN